MKLKQAELNEVLKQQQELQQVRIMYMHDYNTFM